MLRTRRQLLGGLAAAAGWAATARATAPLSAPAPLVRPPDISAMAGQAVAERLAPSGQSGWLVSDLATGAPLEAHRADIGFAPASVAKLPTALFALDRLGPAHRFVTEIVATGPLEQGRVRGDLVLLGGGDPELDTDGLGQIVEALAGQRITGIDGRFLVVDTAAVQVPLIDPGQPIDMAYNPAVSGLNLNFNRVRLRWGRAAGGGVSLSATAKRLDPPVQRVAVQTVSGAASPYVHREIEGREVWSLAPGVLRGTGERWLPVRQPALYAGDVFRVLAKARGIVLPEPEIAAMPTGGRVLLRRESRPLPEILRGMLRYSTNLTAEVVGAAASGGGPTSAPTLAQSAALMNAWIARQAGFALGDPRIGFVNHSGLTPASRVAPSRMVGLLAALAEAPVPPGVEPHAALPGPAAALLHHYNVSVKSDPLPDGPPLVLAKTGTMDRIRGLSGYVATPSGRQLAFAIFSNDLDARQQGARTIATGWMRRARAFERALIRSWVRRFG